MPANPSSSKAATREAHDRAAAPRTRRAGCAWRSAGVGLLQARAPDNPRWETRSCRFACWQAHPGDMGDPDQPHAPTPRTSRWGWSRSVANRPPWASLASADRRDAHHPRVLRHVYGLAGARPRVLAAGRTALRLVGLARPRDAQFLHTLYQFTEPWIVDDSKFRAAFGDLATPLDEALESTLRWYRENARRIGTETWKANCDRPSHRSGPEASSAPGAADRRRESSLTSTAVELLPCEHGQPRQSNGSAGRRRRPHRSGRRAGEVSARRGRGRLSRAVRQQRRVGHRRWSPARRTGRDRCLHE